MTEIPLPSGAVLKMGNIPFATSKALYQAVLEELKGLALSATADMNEVIKNLYCIGFSSKKIESALIECMKRCVYSDSRGELKIDDQTFEPLAARQDYTLVCMEITLNAISPFTKGLSVGLKRLSAMMPSVPS